MTKFFTIPGVTPASDMPQIVQGDPLLPAAGAMMLLDPTHPTLGGWGSGVPADGAVLPNLAWQQAKAARGGNGDATSLGSAVSLVGLSGDKGLVERSTKGGLHAVFSQTKNQSADDRSRLALIIPDAIRYHFEEAYPTNDLYVSLWGRVTRKTLTPGNESTSQLAASTSGGRYIFSMTGGGHPYEGAHPQTLGNRNIVNRDTAGGAPTAGQTFFKAKAVTEPFGTNPAIGSGSERRMAFVVGNFGVLNTYTSTNTGTPVPHGNHGSRVFYRFYMEDLTISGRTYTDVVAQDLALYQREVCSPGGRFYGDTFTDPATIA